MCIIESKPDLESRMCVLGPLYDFSGVEKFPRGARSAITSD